MKAGRVLHMQTLSFGSQRRWLLCQMKKVAVPPPDRLKALDNV